METNVVSVGDGKTLYGVDLFCGGGGTSTGLVQACRGLNRDLNLVAINHWPKAVETHTANHPWAKHLCAGVESIDPRDAVPGGHLDILVASPECIWYSRAAGRRPVNDQRRSSAWQIPRWLEALDVNSVLIENVTEFRDWGPLDEEGYPIKARKGEIYRSFISTIRSFGYEVEERVLNAADYGAPTSRSRLFIQARKGGGISWPAPTHNRKGEGGLPRWRPAKEIIDWGIQGKSIFGRKKPLSPRTVARIIEGLKRFGGDELKPFIVLMEHQGGVKSAEDPLPTITTAKGGAMALVKPQAFILSQGSNGAPKGVDTDPVPAIVTAGKHALVEASFMLSQGSGGAPRSTEAPVPTIPCGGAHALIVPMFGEREGQRLRIKTTEEALGSVTGGGAGAVATPFILPVEGYFQDGRSHNPPRDIERPLGAITQRGFGAVVEPYLVQMEHGVENDGSIRVKSKVKDLEDPLPTVTGSSRTGLVKPYLVQLRGAEETHISSSAKSADDPLPTQTTSNHTGLVEAFLTQYNGASGPQPVTDPLPTVSTRDRFGLVQPVINGYALDIYFRMIQPHELSAAMGFPGEYKWSDTNKDTIKMIGNAVSVDMARALCTALLGGA